MKYLHLLCTNVFLWLIMVNNAKHHNISLQMKFQMNFEYNLDMLQNQAEVKFEAKRYISLISDLMKNSDSLPDLKVIIFCSYFSFTVMVKRKDQQTTRWTFHFLFDMMQGLVYQGDFN